jgi:hypothetical protein
MYSSTLSLNLKLEGEGGQHHSPSALPPGKARYPLYRVGPRAGLDGCEKSRPHQETV